MLFLLYYLTDIQKITVNLTLPHNAIKDTGSAFAYASSKYIKYFIIGNNDFFKVNYFLEINISRNLKPNY